MNVATLNLSAREDALLARAVYIYRQKNMVAGAPAEAISAALGTYLALFEPRFGQPDELSRSVVYGSQRARERSAEPFGGVYAERRRSAQDRPFGGVYAERSRSAQDRRSRRSLDEVARLLVNGHRPPAPPPAADLDEVARRLVQGSNGDGERGRWGEREMGRSGACLPNPPSPQPPISPSPDELGLSSDEHDLMQRAVTVCQRKNGARCSARQTIVESLEAYLRLYEPAYGPQDPLSRTVVHGPQSTLTPAADLDEVARRLVRTGKCVKRGACCRRTIGVRVSAGEIERIEVLGYRREDFLDRDGMIKAGPGGCCFLVDGGAGKTRCRIHPQRPQICRDFFCEVAMRNGRDG